MNPGEVIKQKRIEKRMSIRGLAEAIGVSPAAIQRYESGKTKTIPGQKMSRICEVLGLNPPDMMHYGMELATAPLDMAKKAEAVQTMIDEFNKLMKLRDEGVITDEEFKEIKKKVIDAL